MLETIKKRCRLSTSAFDTEIMSLVEAAKTDLKIAGVKQEVLDNQGELLTNAISCFVKAYMGTDRSDSTRYLRMYETLKMSLVYLEVEDE